MQVLVFPLHMQFQTVENEPSPNLCMLEEEEVEICISRRALDSYYFHQTHSAKTRALKIHWSPKMNLSKQMAHLKLNY